MYSVPPTTVSRNCLTPHVNRKGNGGATEGLYSSYRQLKEDAQYNDFKQYETTFVKEKLLRVTKIEPTNDKRHEICWLMARMHYR